MVAPFMAISLDGPTIALISLDGPTLVPCRLGWALVGTCCVVCVSACACVYVCMCWWVFFVSSNCPC